MKYCADFETTTDVNDCRVWAFSLCTISDDFETFVGTSIDEMFSIVGTSNNTLYFHNLKFDGEYLLYWLFNNGYKHVEDKKDLTEKTFTTLISDGGTWYTMKICHKIRGKNKICTTIIDSLKILNFSVEQIAKAFNLPISKLEINYKKYRAPGYQLDETEKAYVINDVKIVAMALLILFKQGMNKITQGSNAMADYKAIIGKYKFRDYFPLILPEVDKDIRQAYKGGFTYLSDRFKGKIIGRGIVLDVNSLYPSCMYYKPLPYGPPLGFKGEYKPIASHPLYIQMLSCQFKLKKKHIPTIQLKHTLSFNQNEYLTSSKGECVTLCLTSVDLELFFNHYDVWDVTYIGGYAFMQKIGLFKEYIDKWMEIKKQSTIEGNSGMRTLAKLMLNALYGKFGLRNQVGNKIPYMNEDGLVKYKNSPLHDREPVYIPMACFITAWARYTTISAAQSVYDRFVYADTDSLHLTGTELPQNLEIDKTKLGAWDHELTFDKAKFLRQKTYMEFPAGEYRKAYEKKSPKMFNECNGWKITCSGMPSSCYKYVTIDNFKEKSSYAGKLMSTRVKGGVVLVDKEFTIR